MNTELNIIISPNKSEYYNTLIEIVKYFDSKGSEKIGCKDFIILSVRFKNVSRVAIENFYYKKYKKKATV